jgi:large subunit ribosomal protein L35
MRLDFAGEYARRTDDEIRLLIQDRHNLIDEARNALDVEVHRRRSNGFQSHVHEPEEPRVHVEEDEEDGNEVVVRSRELVFPKICPRCLAPADVFVRITCDGGSSWSFFPAVDLVLGMWRYLFFRYPVPFCRGCAISVRCRRWFKRLFFAGTIAISGYLAVRYDLSALRFGLVFLCLYLAGFAIWMVLGISERWPPAGIDILSAWSARDRGLQFTHPEYEKAFVALNSGAGQRR